MYRALYCSRSPHDALLRDSTECLLGHHLSRWTARRLSTSHILSTSADEQRLPRTVSTRLRAHPSAPNARYRQEAPRGSAVTALPHCSRCRRGVPFHLGGVSQLAPFSSTRLTLFRRCPISLFHPVRRSELPGTVDPINNVFSVTSGTIPSWIGELTGTDKLYVNAFVFLFC